MIMVEGKRGQYKYYIIINLILGLMVLALGLFFIFNEYFTGDADWEVCRQSILLRANSPELDVLGVNNLFSFVNSFPLKCKTNVIEIGKNDVDEIKDIIGRTMAECWALYDNGDARAFPTPQFDYNTYCVPCARIHLTEEAKKKLGNDKVDIRNLLDGYMTKEYTYYTYLMSSGRKFTAFNIGSGFLMNLDANNFSIVGKGIKGSFMDGLMPFKNKLTGAEKRLFPGKAINLPDKFNVDDGDLIINYGVITLPILISGSEESFFGHYIPYLFYFQSGQNPDPFGETDNIFFGIDSDLLKGQKFCEYWEGIPA